MFNDCTEIVFWNRILQIKLEFSTLFLSRYVPFRWDCFLYIATQILHHNMLFPLDLWLKPSVLSFLSILVSFEYLFIDVLRSELGSCKFLGQGQRERSKS